MNTADSIHTEGTLQVDGASTLTGAVALAAPPVIPTYTVATAPASPAAGSLAYISDGAAGSAILAFGDGSNWKRSDTGATVAES
jgi:hypothetical protein